MRTPCGFTTVTNVGPTTTGKIDVAADPKTYQPRIKARHRNEMPSYFLSETIKYLNQQQCIMTMTLLDHVRALVEAERDLAEALEQTLPLLSSNSSSYVIPPSSSSLKRGAEQSLLPSPHSSAEVPTILAVARA